MRAVGSTLILILWSVFALGETQSQTSNPQSSIIELAPIRVEGEIPPKDSLSDVPTKSTVEESVVRVKTGVGAKAIDSASNELDIPLNSLEGDEDISLDRRLLDWWLDSSRYSTVHGSQVQLGVGEKPLVRARFKNRGEKYRSFFEIGGLQDYRQVSFRESSGNAFDRSAGEIRQYRNRLEQGYLKGYVQNNQWETLVDVDGQSKDVLSGVENIGQSTTRQESLSTRWTKNNFQWKTFLFARQNQFLHRGDKLASNQTRGWRWGTAGRWPGDQKNNLFELTFSHETWDRDFADNSSTGFQRTQMGLFLARELDLGDFFESRWHMRSVLARDQVLNSVTQDQDLTRSESQTEYRTDNFRRETQQTINSNPTLDVGMSWSTSSKNQVGLLAQARHFTLLPKPSQRFGDGVLLLEANNLQPEKGYRLAAGPWWSREYLRLELTPFYERTENEPMTLAVSPVAARTINMGSILVRGMELKSEYQKQFFKIKLIYTFQEAVNNSSIRWQRGKPLPGRPAHTFSSEIAWERSRWKMGAGYGYRSQEAMDLSGLWFKSPHHDLNAYVGYGTKTWAARLQGAQLLARANDLPHSFYAGEAGVDLLEPKIEELEIKLISEWAI